MTNAVLFTIIFLLLLFIIKQQTKIMGQFEDLSAKIDELQGTVDSTQEQVATLLTEKTNTILALQAHVAELEAQVATGLTPEQLTASIEKLNAVIADVQGTVAPTV